MVVAKLATSGCFVFTIERQSRQSEDCSALTKMMQFNQVFYFVMTKDTRKQLRVILYNKVFNDAIRIVDKLISVDTLGLYVNEPKYFEEELNSGKGRTKIMFEMTFLRNNYIENSIGTVKIELANFQFSSKVAILSLNINGLSQFTANPGLRLQTTNKNENPICSLNLNFYAEKDYLNFQNDIYKINSLKPDIKHSISLCELQWKQQPEGEFSAGHDISMHSSKYDCNVRLKFTFQSSSLHFYQNLGVRDKEMIKKIKEEERKGEEKDSSNKASSEFPFTYLQVRQLQLSQISFKELSQPQLYWTCEVSRCNNGQMMLLCPGFTVTHACLDSTLYFWSCNIPVYFSQKELDQFYVKLRLYDMSTSLVKPALTKEDIGTKRRVPMIPAGFKSLLSFKIPVKDLVREVQGALNQSVFSEKVHVFEAVKYGKVKKYWNTFLKEHYVDNPGRFEELKKVFAQAPPILRISFQGQVGEFVRWPMGALTVSQLRCEFESSRVEVQLGEIQKTFKTNEGDESQPLFNESATFVTSGLSDVLAMRFFRDERIVGSIYQPMSRMSFLNRESCEMVIPGNRFSEELTGRVQFEASYFPIEEHHINRLVTSGQKEQNYKVADEKSFWGMGFSSEYQSIAILLRVQLYQLYLVGVKQDEKVQVTVEVEGEETLISSELPCSRFGMMAFPLKDEIVFRLNPYEEKHRSILITATISTASEERQQFIKDGLHGVLEWTKYPFRRGTEQQVEVSFSGTITQIPCQDAVHTNFIQMGLEISSCQVPMITRELAPFRIEASFHSFKSFYVSLADDSFSEKRLYFLRITNIDEPKNLIVLFARVGVKPLLKNILRRVDNYLKKTISIEQFEKSISYVSAGDKTSTNPKFLYFDKPLHLSFANLDVKGCLSYYKQKAIFKFEICQVTDPRKWHEDEWELTKMSIESTTLYSATFPAYDLIWVSPSWGKESSIALKLAREKNSKDAIITYLSSSKGAVNIGYNPVADQLNQYYLLASVKCVPIPVDPSIAESCLPPYLKKQISLKEIAERSMTSASNTNSQQLCYSLSCNFLSQELTHLEDPLPPETDSQLIGLGVQIKRVLEHQDTQLSVDRLMSPFDYKYYSDGENEFWDWDRTRVVLVSHRSLLNERLFSSLKVERPEVLLTLYNIVVNILVVENAGKKQFVPQNSKHLVNSNIGLAKFHLKTCQSVTLYHTISKVSLLLVGTSRKTLQMLPNASIGIRLIYHAPTYMRDSTYIINKNQNEYQSVCLECKDAGGSKQKLHKAVAEEEGETEQKDGDDAEERFTNLYYSKEKQVKFSQFAKKNELYFKDTHWKFELPQLDTIALELVFYDGEQPLFRKHIFLGSIQFTYDEESGLKPIGRTLVTALVAHSVKDADQLVTSSMFLSLNLQLQESDIPIEELTRDVKEASLSIVQLAKLKRMAEKFAKLIFLDTDFQPVVFMNKLKRTFFNYSPLVVTQEFSGMLKNIIQESGLKRVLPSEPKESWLYIKIPMHSALEIDGSLKLAAYCSMKLSLTIEQQVIEKTCRLKQIHFKIEEKRGADGDEILATKITFMRSIDFFVDFEQINAASEITLSFTYRDKEDQQKEEKGRLEKKAIRLSMEKPSNVKDLLNTQFILVLMKPTNQRIFLSLRQVQSHFIEQPQGIMKVTILRLIRVNSAYVEKFRQEGAPLPYENNVLIYKSSSKTTTDQVSIKKQRRTTKQVAQREAQPPGMYFAQSDLSVRLGCNFQKWTSSAVSPEGVLKDGSFYQYTFYTSTPDDQLKVQLLLSKPTDRVLNEVSVTMGGSGKPDSSNRVLKQGLGVVLAETFIPLSSLPIGPGARTYFIQPLTAVNYHHQSDAMTHFFKMINTQDLYLLGAIDYELQDWTSVAIKFLSLENLRINHLWSGFQENPKELLHFSLAVTLSIAKTDGTIVQLASWMSSTLQKGLASIPEEDPFSFEFKGNNALAVLYVFKDDTTNFFAHFELKFSFSDSSFLISEKYFPLTRFVSTDQHSRQAQVSFAFDLSKWRTVDQQPLLLQEPKMQFELLLSQEHPKGVEAKIAQEFELYQQQLQQQSQPVIFDFRSRGCVEFLCDVLNCGLPQVMQRGIDELNEFLLYTRPEEYKQHNETLLTGLFAVVKLFHDFPEITMLVTQAVLSVVASDQETSAVFLSQYDLHRLLIELIDLCVCMQQGSVPRYEQLIDPEMLRETQSTDDQDTQLTTESIGKQSLAELTSYMSSKRKKMVDNVQSEQKHQHSTGEVQMRGKIVLYAINILDNYLYRNIERTLQVAPFFPSVIEGYRVFDKFVDNMANNFCFLVNDLMQLYDEVDMQNYLDQEEKKDEFKEEEFSATKNLEIKEFVELLKVLILNSQFATQSEFNAILNTSHNLIIFFKNQKKLESIKELLPGFYDMCLSNLKVNLEFKNDLDQHLSILNEHLSLALEMEMEGVVEIVKECLRKQTLMPIADQIARNDLISEGSETQAKFVLKNLLDVLQIAVREYDFKEDLREFCRYLKDRSKAIKDAKRKLAIEQFNGFIQDKLNAVQRVEQLKKRNEELKQKQKQKNIQTMDLKKKQQQIATKYLISNLDWE